jgi:tocopherol O-methyltransferase
MITPRLAATTKEVAAHYDELDAFYREVWGDHVHHGLWRNGHESPMEAAEALVHTVAQAADVASGTAVCDVGSGYGASARLLAAQYGADVTALTLSARQHAYAEAQPADHSDSPGPRYVQGDWMERLFPEAAFDVVWAIESTAHMADKAGFFQEAARTLRPGGRVVVCAWLADEDAPSWVRRWLLKPICEEGRLAGLGTATAYQRWMQEAGFQSVWHADWSRSVRQTWTVCLRRLAQKLATDARYREYLADATRSQRVFVLTMLRIWLAYRVGALRYGFFAGTKPGERGEEGTPAYTPPDKEKQARVTAPLR